MTKHYPARDPSKWGVPWGASVYLRYGRPQHFKAKAKVRSDRDGGYVVTAKTSLSKIVAFGIKDLRTGRDEIEYYHVHGIGHSPIRMGLAAVISALMDCGSVLTPAPVQGVLNSIPDAMLVRELKSRGFEVYERTSKDNS